MSAVPRTTETPAPPPRAQDVLAAAGIPVPAAATSVDCSRSHSVQRVTLPDGSDYVVKSRSPASRDAGRSLVAELYVYRLATWVPGLAELLPRVIHLDERNQLVALVASPGDDLLTARLTDPTFPSPEVLSTLGTTLARLHRATAGIPLSGPASVGIVHLPTTEPEQWFPEDPSPAVHAVGAVLAADTALADALTRCGETLSPSCLVHADLKWDNVAVGPGPQILLFDWELSGRGDPAWDLGSALADTTAHPLRRQLTLPPPELTPGQAGFLRAYAEAAGPTEDAAVPDPSGADLANRVMLCWIARLAHLAIECAGGIGDAEDPVVHALLGAARELCEAEDRILTDVTTSLGVR